jgi:methionyl-tRNA synthetase
MVEKYCDGIVPAGTTTDLDRADMVDLSEYHAALQQNGFLLHEAIKRVMACVARGNEFVQSSQPWALAKNPERRAELESVLSAIMRQLARHAIHLAPIIPNKAQDLWAQLGGPGQVVDQRFADVEALDVTGWRVAKGASLFPKPLPQTPAQ